MHPVRGVPLMLLNAGIERQVREEFDFGPSHDPEDKPLIGTWSPNDDNNFLRGVFATTPGATRTRDLRFRKPPLYPTELRAYDPVRSCGPAKAGAWKPTVSRPARAVKPAPPGLGRAGSRAGHERGSPNVPTYAGIWAPPPEAPRRQFLLAAPRAATIILANGTSVEKERNYGPRMIKVKARGNESVEQMLRRFKKMCEKEGITKDVKRTSYYEKPSERKRRRMRKSFKRVTMER